MRMPQRTPSNRNPERPRSQAIGAAGREREDAGPARGALRRRLTPGGALLVAAGLAAAVILGLGAGRGAGQEKPKPQTTPEKAPARWSVGAHDKTNFPLTGMHRTLNCRDCHINEVFEGTPKTCEVCHWERRQDDRYRLRLGTRCEDCHTPESWKKVPPNKWNHETVTGFKLEGMHQFLDCAECHGTAGFQALPTACFACHEKDYRSTTNPNHVASDFPTDCTQCHSTRNWSGAKFSHTSFVLRGRHLQIDCAACHQNGVYAGTPSECSACHINDYNSTTDPNHSQAGFPLDCTQCHGDAAVSWSGASFTHTSSFVLRGRHLTAACTDCHKNGVYAGTSTACASCHLADYNNTTDPNHRANGYSLECQTCHGTSATGWSGADDLALASTLSSRTAALRHEFPIRAGKHAGLDCADCHKTSSYRQFNCLDCHAHDKLDMDKKHRGVAGYAYNSQGCYACHPRGMK